MSPKAAQYAREVFEIKTYPGNLFDFITKTDNYLEKYKLVLFKEDLDKLSGFISYEKDYAYIGVNYKRPIGHQNLTLAHELGHLFLHHGQHFSNAGLFDRDDKREKEAFNFGFELLYPITMLNEDYSEAATKNLFSFENSAELGKYINSICHKYFLSFEVVLRKLLFKAFKAREYDNYVKNIDYQLGFKHTSLDPNFYISDGSTYSVPYNGPYKYLETLVHDAEKKELISQGTAESILFSYDLLEGK